MDHVDDFMKTRYANGRGGLQEISILRDVHPDTRIIKAYLGQCKDQPYFGQIITVFSYKDRVFVMRFHVWKPHQPPSMANRMSEISEFKVKTYHGFDVIEQADTDFGLKAFWLYTPDSELDEDDLVLRAIAKALKKYSVDNHLCKKFRTACHNPHA